MLWGPFWDGEPQPEPERCTSATPSTSSTGSPSRSATSSPSQSTTPSQSMTRSQTQSFGNSQTPSHAVGNAVPFCNAVAVPEHVGARGGLFHRVHIPVAHSFAERDPSASASALSPGASQTGMRSQAPSFILRIHYDEHSPRAVWCHLNAPRVADLADMQSACFFLGLARPCPGPAVVSPEGSPYPGFPVPVGGW